MYLYLVICLCNIAIAAVIPEEKDATILNYSYKHFENGQYEFSYTTSNGITRYEVGELKNVGEKNEHIAIDGNYSYVDQNGKTWIYQYTADENGYRVQFLESIGLRSEEEIDNFPDTRIALDVSPHIASLLGG